MPAASFLAIVSNPAKFNLFLLKKLPAAFFAGLKITAVNSTECTVSVPYKWFTQNPFRSTYFACLAMAAEMSTGVLAMGAVYGRKPPVSMLIVGMESKFYKKATGLCFFTCTDGAQVQAAIEESGTTGQGQTVRLHSIGVNKAGEMIAEFWFTWSFKSKLKG